MHDRSSMYICIVQYLETASLNNNPLHISSRANRNRFRPKAPSHFPGKKCLPISNRKLSERSNCCRKLTSKGNHVLGVEGTTYKPHNRIRLASVSCVMYVLYIHVALEIAKKSVTGRAALDQIALCAGFPWCCTDYLGICK